MLKTTAMKMCMPDYQADAKNHGDENFPDYQADAKNHGDENFVYYICENLEYEFECKRDF